jgi:maleate isomerase
VSNDNWGSGARFGIFVVGAEVVPEAEWWAMSPLGVSIHAARVTAATPWAQWKTDRDVVVLAPDLERGAAQFASMALSAAVLAHSSSSIMGGPGWDDAVMACLQPCLHGSTAVTTNGLDCAKALRQCGVRRPFIVFPPWFTEDTMRAGAAYFSGHGFQESGIHRQVPEPRWSDVRPQDLYTNLMHIQQNAEQLFDQIVANCPSAADCVLIVGTGLRCVGIIDALESELGRPVVTANQASLWRCLSLAEVGTPVTGYGQLLAGPRDIR